MSIEKLLRYADRLHLETSVAVRPAETKSRRAKSPGFNKHRTVTKLAAGAG